MPNWCENHLTVTGEKEEVLRFQEQVKGRQAQYALSETEKQMYERMGESGVDEEVYNFTFHSLFPVPDAVLEEGYSSAGYNWQSQNWGTKWDVNGVTLFEEDDEVCYEFSTAWAPPEPWVKHVSEQFPKLNFEIAYFEPGTMVAGYVVFENGDVFEEERVSGDVDALKDIMIHKLGYTEEEAAEYWDEEEDEEESY